MGFNSLNPSNPSKLAGGNDLSTQEPSYIAVAGVERATRFIKDSDLLTSESLSVLSISVNNNLSCDVPAVLIFPTCEFKSGSENDGLIWWPLPLKVEAPKSPNGSAFKMLLRESS